MIYIIDSKRKSKYNPYLAEQVNKEAEEEERKEALRKLKGKRKAEDKATKKAETLPRSQISSLENILVFSVGFAKLFAAIKWKAITYIVSVLIGTFSIGLGAYFMLGAI